MLSVLHIGITNKPFSRRNHHPGIGCHVKGWSLPECAQVSKCYIGYTVFSNVAYLKQFMDCFKVVHRGRTHKKICRKFIYHYSILLLLYLSGTDARRGTPLFLSIGMMRFISVSPVASYRFCPILPYICSRLSRILTVSLQPTGSLGIAFSNPEDVNTERN